MGRDRDSAMRKNSQAAKKKLHWKAASKSGQVDYRSWAASPAEYLKAVLVAAALVLAVNYLFYRRWWTVLPLSPAGFFAARMYLKTCLEGRKRKMRSEFREALNCLAVSLRAGYSVENAIRETARDLGIILGADADMTREFEYIHTQVQVSVPVETLLLDFAGRSGSEDIEAFAAVFTTAKKTGGNLVEIILQTARTISDKIDVEREIETSLAAKKYEQKIMSVMPCGIICYMRAASPGFLDVLYTTAFGLVVMTVCLFVYAGAIWWGAKIVDIEV